MAIAGDAAWRIERRRGPAGDLHEESAALIGPDHRPVIRTMRLVQASAAAVVLGSAQPASHIDTARAARSGLAVVRRHSGGGAVVVGPGQVLWIDVVIPAGDRRWDDDIGRAAWWVGDAWAAALGDIGIGPGDVWRRGMLRSPWSDRVCFAGRGPGEVLIAGRKVVGIAQRRTRLGALFQCAALLVWDPGTLVDVLAISDVERAGATVGLRAAGWGVGAAHEEALATAFVNRVAGEEVPLGRVGSG